MSRQDFIDQLKTLGYNPEDQGNNRICFEYTIPVGKFIGQTIRLGFVVGDDFPANPPSGPHISPHLLPINTSSNVHPAGGVHDNREFGAGWQYWSRPFNEWAKFDRSVSTYMAHIRHLFETQ
ncbi:MAG: hypothetical protein K8L91_15935 [Anaerolineae bacterium]|nr:hypothetical protein [Anaerolineae bacterium]